MIDAPADRIVAIVDDDALFRESLGSNLENEGLNVHQFDGGPPALAALDSGMHVDLILLDWKMPQMNGIEVLKQLRARGNLVPVIFLTVLSDQIYEESALLEGAVDFVEKSRSFAILNKRIDLALAGFGKSGTPAPAGKASIRAGALELNAAGKNVMWQGQPVPLTIGEFDIVEALVARAGDNLSYRDIYDIVRGQGFIAGQGDDGYRQNVRTFIKRIRKKFREVDSDFDAIENYPGYGYRWGGDRAET